MIKKNIFFLLCLFIVLSGCIDQNPAPIEYGTSHTRERNYYPIESDDIVDEESKIVSRDLKYEKKPDTTGINDDLYKDTPVLGQSQSQRNQNSESNKSIDERNFEYVDTINKHDRQKNNNESTQNKTVKNRYSQNYDSGRDDELSASIEREMSENAKKSVGTKPNTPKSNHADSNKTTKQTIIDHNDTKNVMKGGTDVYIDDLDNTHINNDNNKHSDTSNLEHKKDQKQVRVPIYGNVLNKFGEVVDGKRLNGVNIQSFPNQIKAISVSNGVVVFADNDDQFGNLVIIKSDNEIFYAYAYLQNIFVKQNDNIASGSVIGEIRNGGILHFAVRIKDKAVDPMKYLK